MSNTIFVHDYETFGTDPKADRASQFAGVRVDEDFNIVEEPINVFCQPSKDFLPNPEACLVTGVTPKQAMENGIPEKDFFEVVNKELGRPGTCGLGYNNINFDDEFTRYGFYRNFINPYEREWKNGNSRWDLIDVLRILHAAYPTLFSVPMKEDGKLSFRLEELTKENKIEHENAHDALADVIGTIEMAKIAMKKAPEAFSKLYTQRKKQQAQAVVESGKPFVMASSFFGSDKKYVEILHTIGRSDKNKNEYYCVKLNHMDVGNLENYSDVELNEMIFSKGNDISAPLHKLQINKCPALLSADYFKESASYVGFNGALCKENLQKVRNMKGIEEKVKSAFNMGSFDPETDVDKMLYESFFSKMDEHQIGEIKNEKMQDLPFFKFNNGVDKRLPELLFRYIGRNAPEVFPKDKKDEWEDFCQNRLNDENFGASIVAEDYFERIQSLRTNDEFSNVSEKHNILDNLEKYGKEIIK